MNWTGGRLQRHSKANSNAQVKAQRDYFARARLRQSTKPSAPSPLHILIAAAPNQQERPRHSLGLPIRYSDIDEGRPQEGRRRSQTFEDAAHKISATDHPSTLHRRAKVQSSHGTTPPGVNTLEHVKRSLLKQSDWLRLAPTRPPKPDHRPVAILEQVGRRRRVTREDRHRQKYVAGQHKIEHRFIKTFAESDDVSALQQPPSANLSIRIGSNIHQSQTTRSQRPFYKPASAVPESSSTEPMLLDMVEAQLLPAMKESREYYLEESKDANFLAAGLTDGQSIRGKGALIPLEQVRDFPSFDEVKRYTSSIKHADTSSARSVSKQLLRGANGPQTRPLQHMSSSLVNGEPIDDQVLFPLDGNNHRSVNIGNEPPGFTEHREDAMMQDIGADVSAIDTYSMGRERRVLRSLDAASAASQKSLSPSEKSNRSDSPPEDAAIYSRNDYDFRDAPYRNTPPNTYSRSLYTIERQVQLEEAHDQQSNHLIPPINTRSNMPTDLTSQHYRGPRKPEKKPASENRDLSIRYFTPEAMEGFIQNGHGQSPRAELSSDGTHHRRQGDENETWMRDVFSTDFEKLQQRFSFAKAPARRNTDQTTPRNMSFREQRTEVANRPDHPELRIKSSRHSSEPSLPETVKTGVNSVLNVQNEPEQPHQRNIFIPSETDFLTQMSPVAGYLDDRIFNLSTYNNSANTVREFIESQHMATKRTASDAFGDSSYDQYDTNSLHDGKMAQRSSPAPHRVPLNTLYQAPVRAYPFEKSQAVHEDPEHMLRTVWRHAKAPSPVKINKTNQSLVSREQFEQTSRTHSQHARFPLDCTPVRVSAPQSRTASQVEVSRQTLHTATSSFDCQFSSPTKSSEHRVPLSSGLATKAPHIGHHEHHPLTTPATNRNAAASARFEPQMSSQSADHAPTSSSSTTPTRQPTRPVGNFHTNHAQRFVFKRPQRPAAQYAHPSRSTALFRAPPLSHYIE